MRNKTKKHAIAITAVITVLLAGAPDALATGNGSNPLRTNTVIGLWNVRVSITNCQSGAELLGFDAMALFGKDGSMHDTNATNPALRSAGFGQWQKLRGRNYQFAFKIFRFDATGANIGYQVVRHEVELAPDGQSYESDGTGTIYDAAGNVLMVGCSRSVATRFN